MITVLSTNAPVRLYKFEGNREVRKGAPGFAGGAIVPWGKLAPYSIDDTSRSSFDYSRPRTFLGVTKLAPSLVDALRKQAHLPEIFDEVIARRLASDVVRNIFEDFECHEYTSPSGFYTSAEKIGNITTDKKSGLRIGIHIDSWERVLPPDRYACSNRICINIGMSPRYFIFFPITLDEMWGSYSSEMSPLMRGTWGFTDLFRFGMRFYPDLPLFALEIAPGEAYLAPTENLAHDGWFTNVGEVDQTFTVRGHFTPNRQTSLLAHRIC